MYMFLCTRLETDSQEYLFQSVLLNLFNPMDHGKTRCYNMLEKGVTEFLYC